MRGEDKRMGDISFAIKDEGNGVVREVKDVTGILHEYGVIYEAIRISV
jgi:hypothetical protein